MKISSSNKEHSAPFLPVALLTTGMKATFIPKKVKKLRKLSNNLNSALTRDRSGHAEALPMVKMGIVLCVSGNHSTF